MAKQLEAKLKPKPQPIPLEWERTALDPATSLPDRSMFDANLHAMLQAGSQTDLSSGLLLVKVDRREQLKSRFGIRGTEEIDKGLAHVIVRAMREQDLVCRLTEDTFGILFPSVDGEAGQKLAQAVRNAVRFHTFRLNGVGPEVLVTASFGYTTSAPSDHPETALSRASEALARSAQRGRNQLHLAEGASVVHCAAASALTASAAGRAIWGEGRDRNPGSFTRAPQSPSRAPETASCHTWPLPIRFGWRRIRQISSGTLTFS